MPMVPVLFVSISQGILKKDFMLFIIKSHQIRFLFFSSKNNCEVRWIALEDGYEKDIPILINLKLLQRLYCHRAGAKERDDKQSAKVTRVQRESYGGVPTAQSLTNKMALGRILPTPSHGVFVGVQEWGRNLWVHCEPGRAIRGPINYFLYIMLKIKNNRINRLSFNYFCVVPCSI